MNTARCPSCGDTLIGFSVAEAMRHLSICDRDPGFVYFGLKPRPADELYRALSGEEPPDKPPFDRMVHYWKMGD